MPVIAEIKAYTPTNGDLLRDRTVEEIAHQYERAAVACVSVVTGRWFGGSPAVLERVARATSLPVLCKDFIVSRSAIERSRELGAGAVLLTRKLVHVSLLKRLAECALSLGLTPFIEVGSAGEMQGLRIAGEAILAVSNRDIGVKETDGGNITTSLSLLEAARATGAGAVVSASAITTAEEAAQLLNAGFDGLLIGSAFLRAPDLPGILDRFRAALLGVER
jgi:indole-3-glycerol phosphate synthase